MKNIQNVQRWNIRILYLWNIRGANIESSQVATYQLDSNEVKLLGHRAKSWPNNNETGDESIHASGAQITNRQKFVALSSLVEGLK